MKFIIFIILIIALVAPAISKKSSKDDKPEWAKKDIRDYSEADLERLLDQWEVSRLTKSLTRHRRHIQNFIFVGR